MTISSWNRDRLRELGLDAALIPPGIDLDNFRPLPGRAAARRHDPGPRSLQPAQEPAAHASTAWRQLPEPRPELCLFGIEPEVATEPGIRYVTAPSDEEVNALFNEATVFVQTSVHEGFCLPPLESMATGGAVVCTDAHGNRDFCADGENCLMPEPDAAAVSRGHRPAAERRRTCASASGRPASPPPPNMLGHARLDALEALSRRDRQAPGDRAVDDAVPQVRLAPRR